MIDGHELSIEEQDQIFFEVNPMDNKGRIYGLGSLGPSMSSGSFSVSQGSGSRSNLYTQQQVNEMMTPLQQEIAATKAAYEQVLEEQARMAQRMDALTQMFSTSSQYHPPPPPHSQLHQTYFVYATYFDTIAFLVTLDFGMNNLYSSNI